ncbi:hypothetical protein Pla22_31960 [Rubripirellula amarantea]|uniref:Uncharacterized protein n=1 Tax=Rubripirellula amarantea TaxID=2527999 RepID=A0A5C5WKG5_9BACT|nr:hypothetical protein Pla22_31960 [Rubripirellula amarantea]
MNGLVVLAETLERKLSYAASKSVTAGQHKQERIASTLVHPHRFPLWQLQSCQQKELLKERSTIAVPTAV